MMIQCSSIIIATWLQMNHNNNASILWNIISEDECIMKAESEEDELTLSFNEELTKVTHQCDELQKKQELVNLH